MPLISVVIPCYNQGKYLNEALASVQAQTYKDFEIIIVNDGSTDSFTIELLQGVNHPRTTVIHTDNQGLSAARNTGISQASGEYVFPLDADDKIGNTYFEKAVNILSKKKDTGIVTTTQIQQFGYYNSVTGNAQEGGVELFVGLENNMVACSMFRRLCWEESGGYDESMKKGMEDWEFWIRVTALGWKVSCIDEPLFYYRRKKSSMVTDSFELRPDLMEYIVSRNKSIYQSHVVRAVMEREKAIHRLRAELLQIKKHPVKNLFTSFTTYMKYTLARLRS